MGRRGAEYRKARPPSDYHGHPATIRTHALINLTKQALLGIAQRDGLEQIPLNEWVAETVPGAGSFGQTTKKRKRTRPHTLRVGLLWHGALFAPICPRSDYSGVKKHCRLFRRQCLFFWDGARDNWPRLIR